MSGEPKRASALDRVFANANTVSLRLVAGGEHVTIEMSRQVAEDVARTLVDALIQSGAPGSDREAGVALFEATEFGARLEDAREALGLPPKLVFHAQGQGSTRIELRLDASKADAFLAQMEQAAPRKKRATEQ